MADKQSLSSNILSTGNKFVVTEKTVDGTFRPGTIGVISYIKGIDTGCSNVVYLTAVVLKRGKTGKPRIDLEQVSTPIFSFETMDSSGIMPDKKRKRYIFTEPAPQTYRTIYEMEGLEFLGWSLAWVLYLRKLSKCTKPFCIWPRKNGDLMNKMLNISSFWYENAEYTVEDFCSPLQREKFINRMRTLESTLVNCSLSYMIKVTESEVNAADYLIHYNNKEKVYNEEVLYNTYNFFKEKHKNLKALDRRNKSASKKGVNPASPF